jgi:hypothetical protein
MVAWLVPSFAVGWPAGVASGQTDVPILSATVPAARRSSLRRAVVRR